MPKRAWHILIVITSATTAGPPKAVVAQNTPGDHRREAVQSKRDSVPIQAPDATPAWFNDDSSYTAERPRYLKHVIGVAFREGTTRAARQATIDAVGGRVVGGWRASSRREGLYAVQIPDSGSEKRRQHLIEKLWALSHVRAAIDIFATTTNK